MVIPTYSISSDLLGYRQCSLQYRYTRISQLPPSKPVQMWFGQFIHNVLEHTFKFYKEKNELPDLKELINICDEVKDKLASRGLYPRNWIIYDLAIKRLNIAISKICKDLFVLMKYSEIKLNSTQKYFESQIYNPSEFYEIVGIIDILSKSKLQLHFTDYNENLIKRKILEKFTKENIPLPVKNSDYEIIVDYKGTYRPPCKTSPDYPDPISWDDHLLQLNLYKHLREKQPESGIVIAGIIIYINELNPTKSEMKEIKKQLESGLTDVIPHTPSDEKSFDELNPDDLSDVFRVNRAIRIEILNDRSKELALRSFEKSIVEIEQKKFDERRVSNIIQCWQPKNPPNKETCAVCDQGHHCPKSPRKSVPKPSFEFDESIDFDKRNYDLDYFITTDSNIEKRAYTIEDNEIILIQCDNQLISAQVKRYSIDIDLENRYLKHTGCVDYTLNRMKQKNFCKHIYRLFLLLGTRFGKTKVLEILDEIGNNIRGWRFIDK